MNPMRALLIATVSIGIASVAATIMIGARTFEETVVADPYETGLRWDDARNERHLSGWRVSLETRTTSTGQAVVVVRSKDRQNLPLRRAAIRVAFSRPETARYDRAYPLEEQKEGRYTALVDLPRTGRWEARITVTHDGRTAVFTDALYVHKER